MNTALLIAFKLLLCYLLGSLSGSLLIGRWRGIDLRRLGSGNAGGTNAFRTQGFAFALAVVLIDLSKGALAVLVGRYAIAEDPAALQLGLLGLLAATAGHIWPVFFGFRGGKGAATLAGGLLLLAPMFLLGPIVVWILTLLLSGYVSLATVLTGLSLLPCSLWLASPVLRPTWALASIGIAFLLLYTHRENLGRLRAGCEYRFEGARLFHRFARRARRQS